MIKILRPKYKFLVLPVSVRSTACPARVAQRCEGIGVSAPHAQFSAKWGLPNRITLINLFLKWATFFPKLSYSVVLILITGIYICASRYFFLKVLFICSPVLWYPFLSHQFDWCQMRLGALLLPHLYQQDLRGILAFDQIIASCPNYQTGEFIYFLS